MFVTINRPALFDSLLNEFVATESAPRVRSFPAIDVARHENETMVVAELPGVRKEDLKLTVEGGTLTISGERKPYEIPKDARILLNEMRVRSFSRSIQLPEDVDTERISASMENGILRVMLPKAEWARPRTIDIR